MEPVAEALVGSDNHEESFVATRRPTRLDLSETAVQAAVDGWLINFEQYFAEQLSSRFSVVDRMMNSAAALQGKRLRPQLVCLGALACGSTTESTLRLASVVEMVHGATLVHDDVLDGASLRRHAPAAHVQWGTNPSILLGDILFSKAYLLAAGEGSPYPAQRVGQAGLALCEGELRQQSTIGRWRLGQEEYLDILRQKTGELCAASAALGAWSSLAEAAQVSALESFGLKLGIAFQIFDDWLDVWGSAATGKPHGNDIANRKPTLPTIFLLESLNAQSSGAVLRKLDAGNLDDELMLLFHEHRCSDRTLAVAEQFAREAVDSLGVLPESGAKRLLVRVAEHSVRRVR